MPYPEVRLGHRGLIALRDETKDAIRRFGDRLERVYSAERSDELIELIRPLFREGCEDADRAPEQPGVTSTGTRLG